METSNHIVTTSPQLRFKAGKLIMVSPKHKEKFKKRPQSVSFVVYKELRGSNIPAYYRNDKSSFKWNGIDGAVDFFLYPQGHLAPGIPLLLLDDPKETIFEDFSPEREKSLRAAPQRKNCKPPRRWQIRFMLTDKESDQIWMCHAIVSNKVWMHYLCVVVPRRAEKYGI